VSLLRQVDHLVARDNDLEDSPVDLPVPQLAGALLVHPEVGDVQPVPEVVQYQARIPVV
jgi:hypothetical protein